MNAEMLYRDGWVKNDGVMPVEGHVRVDTKWAEDRDWIGDIAKDWSWGNPEDLTHWRLHNAACTKSTKSLEDGYDHLNTGNWDTSTWDCGAQTMSAAEYIKTLNVPEGQPLGLPLSRVCKAFEAITGHPMSEEHAEVFVSVLEMCKGFAVAED